MKSQAPILAALLLAGGTLEPALAQEWTAYQPTTIDGLKYATSCLQRAAGRSPVRIKLANTTDAELSGWFTYTIAGAESPHKKFAIKPHSFSVTFDSGNTLGCSSGITVTVGQ